MNCKKCPFCGCNAAIARDITWLYFVQCQNCGCRTRGTQTQEEAVRIWNKWEPKEDKMDNEKTTKIDTEAELKAKLDEANEKIKDLRDKVDSARLLCAWKNGEIEGLHYAIRHFAKGRKEKK